MPATTYTSTADTSGAALVREEVWQQVHRQIIQSRRVAEKTDKLSSTTWEWIGRKDRFQCVGCSSCEEHQELLENCLDSFEL